MAKYEIPKDLVQMLKERRVIPFIGAGFSSFFELPRWDDLLSSFEKGIDDTIPYEQVKKYCDNDLRQVAEYYFLKAGSAIGPLRQCISNRLITENIEAFRSSVHLDLINLGSPQIYTTNYDDLIEKTFKCLGLPYEVIALPKDIAKSNWQKVQIVKYHGDLKYDNTLVITESSYYSRLDFESPMDLKFRSDLLGRSVLFMGYGFADINIRIIWFKLMDMMKDIPKKDRQKSYIVKFNPNPVLEELYEAVGIETIVLDPEGKDKTKEQKVTLFARFMNDLVNAINEPNIPGHADQKMFLAEIIIEDINEQCDRILKTSNSLTRGRYMASLEALLDRLKHQTVVPGILDEVNDMLIKISHLNVNNESLVKFVLNMAQQYGFMEGISSVIAKNICRQPLRDIILESGLDWDSLWCQKISSLTASSILDEYQKEIEWTKKGGKNEDVFYFTDLAYRIKDRQIIGRKKDIQERAQNLIEQACNIYPQLKDYQPESKGKPNIGLIIAEIYEDTKS